MDISLLNNGETKWIIFEVEFFKMMVFIIF